MRFARLAIFAAVAALGSALLTAPADASHSWSGYHWARQSNPFTLSVADNVTPAWDGYLDRSISEWSESDVLDLTEVAGSNTKQCRATRGRVEVCNAKYGKNGWLGLASIWLTTGNHITAGTAKMNDTYFAMSRYNTPDERAHVMCQEIAHTFGLGHTSEDGTTQNTCMDYSMSPTSTGPNAHDFAQLATIYAHLDSFTTVGTSSASTSSPRQIGESRADWGREVYRGEHHSIFARNLGVAGWVITEVTWADGHHDDHDH